MTYLDVSNRGKNRQNGSLYSERCAVKAMVDLMK